jgi:hypothetical protein
MFLKLSMFAFELKNCGPTSHMVKICRLISSATPDPLYDAGREGVAELHCRGGALCAAIRSSTGNANADGTRGEAPLHARLIDGFDGAEPPIVSQRPENPSVGADPNKLFPLRPWP